MLPSFFNLANILLRGKKSSQPLPQKKVDLVSFYLTSVNSALHTNAEELEALAAEHTHESVITGRPYLAAQISDLVRETRKIQTTYALLIENAASLINLESKEPSAFNLEQTCEKIIAAFPAGNVRATATLLTNKIKNNYIESKNQLENLKAKIVAQLTIEKKYT
ncbi:MAG: hypothetical protein P4M12_01205 [Gammaproteobacteria bacterium]|nr:hypothetical protein [Gammaproteobacteria bacterium]